MTRREMDRIARLRARAAVLRARIEAGVCTKLDAEVAELSALDWCVETITAGKLSKRENDVSAWAVMQKWLTGITSKTSLDRLWGGVGRVGRGSLGK